MNIHPTKRDIIYSVATLKTPRVHQPHKIPSAHWPHHNATARATTHQPILTFTSIVCISIFIRAKYFYQTALRQSAVPPRIIFSPWDSILFSRPQKSIASSSSSCLVCVCVSCLCVISGPKKLPKTYQDHPPSCSTNNATRSYATPYKVKKKE